MKRTKSISIIILSAVMAGCTGNKQATDDFITIDVNASYPEKELVLQDLMDVEYIPLETSDEFITKGVVKAVGKDILLVTNRNDGDIFVFDRKTGKGLRKINRLGQSGEEYSGVTYIVLDENENEMFVIDYSARKILVYDLFGNFNRSFKFVDTAYYTDVFNYDRDHLICYKSYSTPKENEQACHLLISKQDGSVAREIRFPFEAYATPVISKDELTVTPEFYRTFSNKGNWVLVDTSSDTIYHYLSDGNRAPFIVRTPSIHSMEPEVFLFPTVITDRYCFMRTMKKELDFTTFKGYPNTDLVYDKQENAIFSYTLYNDDFSNKKEVSFFSKPETSPIAICKSLDAPELVEAYEKGRLKGQLKEIVAELDEESNPVVMLVKYRK